MQSDKVCRGYSADAQRRVDTNQYATEQECMSCARDVWQHSAHTQSAPPVTFILIKSCCTLSTLVTHDNSGSLLNILGWYTTPKVNGNFLSGIPPSFTSSSSLVTTSRLNLISLVSLLVLIT